MYKVLQQKLWQPPCAISKLLLIMKLTTFILITVILQVSATTFAQKITLSEKNSSLVKVFDKISDQSGYDFLVSSEMLRNAKPVNIEVSNLDGDSGNTVQSFSDQSVQLILPDSCPSFLSWYSPCPGRSVSIN
jgi:hypothetical protein